MLVLWPLFALAQEVITTRAAVILDVEGAIGPATRDYIHRALEDAAAQGAELLVLRMDTPGGLDSSMRDIVKDILGSAVPVVTYVAPSGARAASAGTYILYASHVAAMAPATSTGAATPVQVGAPGLPRPGESRSPQPENKGKESEGGDETGTGESRDEPAAGSPMERKIVNDAVAYIRGLAELRGRNAEWAEKAVREAASLDANEALAEGVIDILATDVSDLLKQLQGRKVSVLGQEKVLDTENLTIRRVEPDWRSRLLSVITNPNVAYILMLIGIYGLIFEFSNPGAIVPGITGAICLLLALFAFQVLPVNYTGLALIILGIGLMVAEAFAPSFGALGIGGVIAFVFGSVILMETDVPGFQLALPLIITFALSSLLMFTIVLGMLLKARRRPVVSGQEQLTGGEAETLEAFDREGQVRIHSEIWHARTSVPLRKGQKVRVTKMDGLTLWVEPAAEQEEMQ